MNASWLGRIRKWIQRSNPFELGISVGLYYLLQFFLAPLTVLLGYAKNTDQLLNYTAFLYLMLGFISFIVGYSIRLPDIIVKCIPNPLKGTWNFSKAFVVFSVTFLIGLVAKVVKIYAGGYFHLDRNQTFLDSSWYGVVNFAEWFSCIALVIAFIAYFYQKQNKGKFILWGFVAWGVLLLEIMYAIPSCTRKSIIVPIVLYLLIRSYMVKVEYRKIALVLLLTIIIVMPLGNVCRNQKILQSYNVTTESGEISIPNPGKLVVGSIVSRISAGFSVLPYIIESSYPRQGGRTFLDFFVGLGPPRFIWKSKPLNINSTGNEFGHEIGILHHEDFTTSVGPTIIGEWYINFGLLGIIVGMLLMGLLWRLIYLYAIKNTKSSPSGILVYSIAWIQIITGLEGWTGPVYVGLVRILILLFAINFFITHRATTS